MGTEHRSKEEWYDAVARFETAQIPAKEFCRREGLNYWTFCGWRRRMRDESPSEQLVEIGPIPAGGASTRVLLRVRFGDTTVEFECEPEERQLCAILTAVRSLSC